jgi:hypothetical protein
MDTRTDVVIILSKNSNTCWIIGESYKGQAWLRANFDGPIGYCRKEDVEGYINAAKLQELNVEEY